MIDLAGVEQAGLEPPSCEPAEDRAQERLMVLGRLTAEQADEISARLGYEPE